MGERSKREGNEGPTMRDNWLSLTNLYVCWYVFYSDLLRARTFINDKYRVLHKMKYYDNNK